MKTPPTDPELLYRLAGEYVLGTMTGPARRRFARWREESARVDECCVFWEERLMPLLRELKPLEPPAHVWPRIEARLALGNRAGGPVRAARTRRMLAVAATVLLTVVAGSLLYRSRVAPLPTLEAATVATSTGAPIWELRILGRAETPGALAIQTRAGATPPTARAYELWALPKGGKPVSLGVLPAVAGTITRTLAANQWQALLVADRVAVSIEPPGGSPTGQPTGSIAFVSPLRRGG